DRVGVALVGNIESSAPALPRFDVPTAAVLDAGGCPERFFQRVGAGVVAARDEAGLGLRDRLERTRGALGEANFRRIVLRSDDDEIVVHHQTAIEELALG